MNKLKNSKFNKGITLVALVVTIVVLLILAGISINLVLGENGLITQAKEAANKTSVAGIKENQILEEYTNFIDQNNEDLWKQNGNTIVRKDQVIKIGDYVNYKANVDGYNDENGWRVIGVEDGKILLVSTNLIEEKFLLRGASDYLNETGVKKLNKECEKYGKGKYAESARCINIQDVNNITGYDPICTGNGEIYQKGKIDEYNNNVSYELEDGKVKATSKNGEEKSENTSFIMPDGRILGKDMEKINIRSNSYFYVPTTLINSYSGEKIGLATDSEEYKLLFRKYGKESEAISYWLADNYAEARAGQVVFGIFGIINNGKGNIGLYSSSGNSGDVPDMGIRAVIKLENVNIESVNENSWKIL